MTAITRRYRFAASHRLHSPEMTEHENVRVYGKCNNPFGHGHNYILEVTVGGKINDATGLIVPLQDLDRLVEEIVMAVFAHRNINLDVPQFKTLIPTTENIVLVVADLLHQNWDKYLGSNLARLQRVHIQETERNGFELILAGGESRSAQLGEAVVNNA